MTGPVGGAATAREPGGQGPIASATASLIEWLAGSVDVPVRAAAPQTPDEGTGLSVWPLALLPERELRSAGPREPLRFRVRHLVTGDVDALDRVLVAAVEAGEPAISLESPSDQAWLALGAKPQPALLIDVPARVGRPTPSVPLVRGPLRVRGGTPQAIRGRVLGPGEVPLPGMRVEVVSTGAWAYADAAGRFAFAAVPREEPLRLAVQGKGTRLTAEINAG